MPCLSVSGKAAEAAGITSTRCEGGILPQRAQDCGGICLHGGTALLGIEIDLLEGDAWRLLELLGASSEKGGELAFG